MADTQTATNHEAPQRRTRSDAGKPRAKGNPNIALIDVLKALDGLAKEDMKRVLSAAAIYFRTEED